MELPDPIGNEAKVTIDDRELTAQEVHVLRSCLAALIRILRQDPEWMISPSLGTLSEINELLANPKEKEINGSEAS
jgi:hypothetical protein